MGVLSILADDVASLARGSKRLWQAGKRALSSEPEELVAQARPVTRKVFGNLNGYSNDLLQQGLNDIGSGAYDAIANAAEETAALSAKNSSELLSAVSGDFASLNGIEEAIETVAPKVSPTYNTYRRLENIGAKGRQTEGLSWLSHQRAQEPVRSTGVNAKEISESAMRDTGYGMTSEERALMKHRPDYINNLRTEGEKARNLSERIDSAGTAASAPPQPEVGLPQEAPQKLQSNVANTGATVDQDKTNLNNIQFRVKNMDNINATTEKQMNDMGMKSLRWITDHSGDFSEEAMQSTAAVSTAAAVATLTSNEGMSNAQLYAVGAENKFRTDKKYLADKTAMMFASMPYTGI